MVVSFFLTHLLLELASPIILFLHSTTIHLQEAKDSFDEEDPRPSSSHGATSGLPSVEHLTPKDDARKNNA